MSKIGTLLLGAMVCALTGTAMAADAPLWSKPGWYLASDAMMLDSGSLSDADCFKALADPNLRQRRACIHLDAAHPNTNFPSLRLFGDWALYCIPTLEQSQTCDIAFAWNGSKLTDAAWLEGPLRHKDQPLVLSILAPYGVLLDYGLGLKIGNESIQSYPFETCEPAGCYATIALTPEIDRALLSGKTITAFVQTSDHKTEQFVISTKGWRDARRHFPALQPRKDP